MNYHNCTSWLGGDKRNEKNDIRVQVRVISKNTVLIVEFTPLHMHNKINTHN